MKIKGEIILPHIYTITYPTQYELCMSFVRMQEFYESPKFRGKYFTLEEYMDYWCANQGKGSFTYPSVWNGFNVPGDVLKNWIEKVSKNNVLDVRKREIDVLKVVKDLMDGEGLSWRGGECLSSDFNKIYVIGVHEESNDKQAIIDHESSHAFYRFYPEYRKVCDKITKKIAKKSFKQIRDYLIFVGYNKKVIEDEIQAYGSTGDGRISSCIFSMSGDIREEFKNNFRTFRNNLVKK